MKPTHLIFALVILVAGCGGQQSTENNARPEAKAVANIPVDIETVNARLHAENPGTVAIGVLDRGNQGFVFRKDGRVAFRAFRSISGLVTRSWVDRIEGNEICVRETDTWGGACMQLFSDGDRAYRVEGAFSNGAPIAYDAKIVLMDARAAKRLGL